MSVLPTWFKGLTPELRKKAEIELGETEVVRAEALQKMKKFINDRPELQHCRPDDAFLLRFLRFQKFDEEKAGLMLQAYCAMLARHRGTYTARTLSQLEHVLAMRAVLVAPQRLPSGAHVTTVRLGCFECCAARVCDLVGAVLWSGELTLECEATQVSGCVLVLDCARMSSRHCAQLLSLSLLSFLVSLLQGSWPIRVGSIHMINESYAVHVAYHLVKPLLKKKTKDRLHYHGSNAESLHGHVPPQYLHQDMGGFLDDGDCDRFAQQLAHQQSLLLNSSECCIPQKHTVGK